MDNWLRTGLTVKWQIKPQFQRHHCHCMYRPAAKTALTIEDQATNHDLDPAQPGPRGVIRFGAISKRTSDFCGNFGRLDISRFCGICSFNGVVTPSITDSGLKTY